MGQTDEAEPMFRLPIPEETPPSRATFVAVAEAKDCDPLDLPPLTRAIDPDALDAFLDESGAPGRYVTEFEYAECLVTVTAEDVRVFPS